MDNLRDQIIRLAYEKPELRGHLLPLIKSAEEEEAASGKGGVSGAMVQFLKEVGDQKVKNPDTGNQVKIKSLKGERGSKLQKELFQKWKAKKDQSKAQGRDDAKKIQDLTDKDREKETQRLLSQFKSKSPKEQERIFEKATGKKVKIKPKSPSTPEEASKQSLQKLVDTFHGLSDQEQARVRKNLGI